MKNRYRKRKNVHSVENGRRLRQMKLGVKIDMDDRRKGG